MLVISPGADSAKGPRRLAAGGWLRRWAPCWLAVLSGLWGLVGSAGPAAGQVAAFALLSLCGTKFNRRCVGEKMCVKSDTFPTHILEL